MSQDSFPRVPPLDSREDPPEIDERLTSQAIGVVEERSVRRSVLVKQLESYGAYARGYESLHAMHGLREVDIFKNASVIVCKPRLPGIEPDHARTMGVKGIIYHPVFPSELHAALKSVLDAADFWSPEAPAGNNGEALRARAAGIRVLLVEDNPINQTVALRQLKHLGYETELATNGREAVEMTKSGRYDAILMDIQMPEMDGIEATRVIRSRDNLKRVPIIALTADFSPDNEARYLEAGMDAYVPKPVRLEDLANALYSRISP